MSNGVVGEVAHDARELIRIADDVTRADSGQVHLHAIVGPQTTDDAQHDVVEVDRHGPAAVAALVGSRHQQKVVSEALQTDRLLEDAGVRCPEVTGIGVGEQFNVVGGEADDDGSEEG